MRINSKDTILDVPILRIRKLLRRSMSHGSVIFEKLASQTLKLGEQRTREILDELVRQGYYEARENRQGEPYWENTIKGNSLAMATAARPVTRAKADKIFGEFVLRVKEVNDDPYYLFKVNRVVLFGSYIRDTETVNDIDIAIQLAPKIDDLKLRSKLYAKRRRKSKRKFRTLMAYLGWPMQEVWLFLKSRSRALSLHDFASHEKLLETIETRVILDDVSCENGIECA
jgi:predicted nucleotidyltransferase